MMKSKKQYQHLFFDLDKTLWDFDASAHFTFNQIYTHFKLSELGIASVDAFLMEYHIHNNHLWDLYRKGEIRKDLLRSERFKRTLAAFSKIDDHLADSISDYYLYHSPRNVFLFPGVHETLLYLSQRYQLHIITNGFEEVQRVKLDQSDLRKYFQCVITSEKAGVKKPDSEIFRFALLQAKADADNSVMIGDDLEVDIAGAQKAGMDQIYFNPDKQPCNVELTWEINDLKQLTKYF